MNRIFIGFDHRQCVSYTALHTSIITQSTEPCSITPLVLHQLPLKRVGLTPFTFSRFLVPYLCDYKGWALFLDIDMILLDDITKLFSVADEEKAVLVSKNEKKFEWASAILFNCGHEANKILKPEYIEQANGLHQIKWLDENLIGDIPPEWNHLVGYDQPRTDAKLIHFTQGVPVFKETAGCEYSGEWNDIMKFSVSAQKWDTLMGNSVHAVDVNGTKIPRFKAEQMLANGEICAAE